MWYLGPYFILSCVLLFATLTYPIAHSLLGEVVLRLVITLMLVSALYAVIKSRVLFRVMIVLLVPTLIINWIVDADSHAFLAGAATLSTILFFSITFVAVFADIVASKRVTGDVIFGSIAAYLLFGISLALAYFVVNTLDPGNAISSVSASQTAAQHPDDFSDFLYFSFITLTSVGYGDISPVGSAARGLAIFEGIFGQLYVAILIARLVAIQISQE